MEKMIDIHSHILFEIDDGSKNIEESVSIIKELKDLGFSKIIVTPHYMETSNYCANNTEKEKKLNLLKKELKDRKIDIDLYLGNEIYINSNILNLMKNNEISSLNKTKYLLIEFPLFNEINDIDTYLYELQLKGYKIILAHPERYSYFQKDYSKMSDLFEKGILFQLNYASILGHYGKNAKKLFKYALKNEMVSFLATDIHRANSYLFTSFDKSVTKIKKIVGEEKFKEIAYKNALELLICEK